MHYLQLVVSVCMIVIVFASLAGAKSSDYDSSSDISDTNNDVLDSRYHLINKFDNQFYEAVKYISFRR